jgi:hypothetical protein
VDCSDLTQYRHQYALRDYHGNAAPVRPAEISKMTRGGEFEVRVAAVPNDFVPPKEGTFVKETMNALADLGERMGANTNSWLTSIP